MKLLCCTTGGGHCGLAAGRHGRRPARAHLLHRCRANSSAQARSSMDPMTWHRIALRSSYARSRSGDDPTGSGVHVVEVADAEHTTDADKFYRGDQSINMWLGPTMPVSCRPLSRARALVQSSRVRQNARRYRRFDLARHSWLSAEMS
jgi:hypothetical protein